jgi:hypothetical protein
MELPICHEIVAHGNLDIRGDRSFRPGANDGARDTSNTMTQGCWCRPMRAFLKASGVNADGASAARDLRAQLGGYQRRPQP